MTIQTYRQPMARRHLLRLAATLAVAAAAFAPAVRAMTQPGTGDAAMQAAFNYAFPLFEFARMEQTLTESVGGPGTLNRIKQRSQLSDYRSRNVTAPNNDTIYSSLFLELSGGPVEASIPTMRDRYFSVAFMDAFTDNFAYLETRTTGGEGGRVWVVSPDWNGKVPDGVRLVQSTTNDAWMLARILVDGPDDLPAAEALQQQISATVAADRPPARGFNVRAEREASDAANFLAVVNEMLKRSKGGAGQLVRAERFAALGIGAEAPPPSPALLAAWAAYLPSGIADLRQGFLFRDLVVNGWSYQPRGVGDFGTNDHLRAMIALGGIAALGEQEAMYFHANFDASGERLNGANNYRWRLPPGGVPADAFWSLTMYDAQADGRYYLVENPLARYSIGDRTPGLVREADGSIVILIQRDRPEGAMAANWLPAPGGTMRLALRAYMPRAELIERNWRVPPLEQVVAKPAPVPDAMREAHRSAQCFGHGHFLINAALEASVSITRTEYARRNPTIAAPRPSNVDRPIRNNGARALRAGQPRTGHRGDNAA
ncbi:MAG: DUF1254 domain-containing protein [Sphingopyxis terrae]|nr:DUF1254 domain-containing protein [Sphingopyxis terrae]